MLTVKERCSPDRRRVPQSYMRNRWYDSAIGRFLSRDPIGLKAGQNEYAYVGNSPINRVDSRGLAPETDHMTDNIDIFVIQGGNSDARSHVEDILMKIENTARGKEITDAARKAGTKVNIQINEDGINEYSKSKCILYLDPFHPKKLKHIDVMYPDGTVTNEAATFPRVLGHELGHATIGTGDTGTGNMNNVNQNENPIITDPAMGPYQQHQIRIKY